MAIATRTINPLHFEDLEPHRFEDLVRQLIYGFRDWNALEATGRLGSDVGFDARGWELVSPSPSVRADDASENDSTDGNTEENRVWLIQCKREKAISPKKLVAYLGGIDANEVANLHGLIFVAACDFSKRARDEFRVWCLNNGLKEFLIWGKAELEDMLFQPLNDHLLFGYFGISLQIKKRSTKTRLRSVLAMKKQAIRCLGGIEGFAREPVLLRDPEAKSYPSADEIVDFDEHPRWRVYHFVGHYHSGIKILIRTHFAYLSDDGKAWDAEERVRTNLCFDDPWPKRVQKDLEYKAREFWTGLPEKNRATLEVVGLIPYDEILAIDENGDEHFPHSHIYVFFHREGIRADACLMRGDELIAFAEQENQIKYFPDSYPSPSAER